jgi:phosphoesterase RecJ-like protein
MNVQHQNTAKAIFQKLSQARRPILIAHRKPDGDTLGAMMAVYNHLRNAGREAIAFCVDVPPEPYAYIQRIREVKSDPAVFRDESIDLICVFDAGDLDYTGAGAHVEAMPRRPFVANFDHHVTNTRFGDLNLVVTDASSTAEVVHDFFTVNSIECDRGMAACVMTGIMTDTSSFSNPATTVGSLEIAAALLLKGVSIPEINRSLIRNKPMPALKLWGRALERLRWDARTRIASTALFQDDFKDHPVDDEYVRSLSNFLNRVLDVAVVLVLKETPEGLVSGSYRSSDDTDVAALALSFGGGGHKKAAGFVTAGKIIESENGWTVAVAAPTATK